MAIHFETCHFEHSHMRQPRGRGSWAFSLEGREELFWHNGTYAEARKAASDEQRKIMKAQGVEKSYVAVIHVEP